MDRRLFFLAPFLGLYLLACAFGAVDIADFFLRAASRGELLDSEVGSQQLDAAWTCLAQGQRQEAQKAFAVSTSRINNDIVDYVFQHLKGRGLDVLRAPSACGFPVLCRAMPAVVAEFSRCRVDAEISQCLLDQWSTLFACPLPTCTPRYFVGAQLAHLQEVSALHGVFGQPGLLLEQRPDAQGLLPALGACETSDSFVSFRFISFCSQEEEEREEERK